MFKPSNDNTPPKASKIRPSKTKPDKTRLATASLLAGALFLGACAAGPRVPGIYEPGNEVSERLGASELPAYRKGDTFRYAGGRVEQVVAVKGNDIHWKRENGNRFISDRNFLLPPESWESKRRVGEQKVVRQWGEVWPLALGRLKNFRIQRNMTDKRSGKVKQSFRSFDCTVTGAEAVAVPAGTFDAYEITCRRYTSSGSRLVQTRTFHYAPKVGHYVRREIENHRDGKRKVIELASYKKAGT